MRWTVLIPVKALPDAKSRLALLPGGDRTDPSAHEQLVRALRTDTVAAARACSEVDQVILVVDRPIEDAPPGVEQFQQSGPGLNNALREAAIRAGLQQPEHGVAALLGDLPALRPDELAAALSAAAANASGRSFVRDAQGTGTTLLAVVPRLALDPQFGPDSARRHAATAVELVAGPGLRHDVDTVQDLVGAVELGVGEATAEAVRAGSGALSLRVHLDSA